MRLLERSLYAAIFTIVKIARHYIIFWWKCGKSRSQIWHCDVEKGLFCICFALENMKNTTSKVGYCRNFPLIFMWKIGSKFMIPRQSLLKPALDSQIFNNIATRGGGLWAEEICFSLLDHLNKISSLSEIVWWSVYSNEVFFFKICPKVWSK